MKGLETSMQRILQILESDSRTNEKGLVEKVGDLQKSLSELLTREKIYKAKAGVWGTVGGIIGYLIMSLITKGLPSLAKLVL